jgi:hypothetical protein
MICIEIYQKESVDDKKNATGPKCRDFPAVSGRKRGPTLSPVSGLLSLKTVL